MKIVTDTGRTIHVTIQHNNNVSFNGLYGTVIAGKTEVWVDTGTGSYSGIAYCTLQDQYNKKIGVKHALSRALVKTDLTKNERRNIWDRLRRVSPKVAEAAV